MPVPGPAEVAWRSPDGRAALLRWGRAEASRDARAPRTQATRAAARRGGRLARGDDLAGHADAGQRPRPGVRATPRSPASIPVYLAEVAGAVIVADRATWAAWTADRLDDHDPLHACALLNPGFPLGSATPFRGVSALVTPSTIMPGAQRPPPAG